MPIDPLGRIVSARLQGGESVVARCVFVGETNDLPAATDGWCDENERRRYLHFLTTRRVRRVGKDRALLVITRWSEDLSRELTPHWITCPIERLTVLRDDFTEIANGPENRR